MANKIKGQVQIEHGGEEYTLAIDFNALADFEDEAGIENALELLQNPSALGVKKTRLLFWCGLRENHPELTVQDAGRLLSANPAAFGEALQAAFPQGGDAGNGKPASKARR